MPVAGEQPGGTQQPWAAHGHELLEPRPVPRHAPPYSSSDTCYVPASPTQAEQAGPAPRLPSVTQITPLRVRPPVDGTWTSRTVDHRVTVVGPRLGRRLQVSPGEPVLRITRLRMVGGDPMGVERLHLPQALVPGLTAADLETGSFYRLPGDRYGIVPTTAAQTIEPTAHSRYQYPTISGMTTADVHALVSSRTERSAAVTRLTSLVVDAGLTGVDVDLEDYWSWSKADFDNYKTFLRRLATALHAKGKRLQVDAPAMTEDAPFYDYAAVSATGVDELVIMAYDHQYDTEPGAACLPITPYDWLKDVTAYAQSKVPDPNRLVIGLPSYGYSAPAPCDLNAVTGNIHFADMRHNPGFSADPATIERRRDPSSGEIRWTSGGVQYDYVDRVSLDRKLAVLTGLGVTKVSVWTLGGANPWFTR
ncbi:UTRA domain-containing protein [Kitasatospora camelliae]|uniref:UTRA domain-containing protein n=1 Tax=Kitasatospora camelliae TaxID=3156397 RepID=A0AAU8JNW6_9ACTN